MTDSQILEFSSVSQETLPNVKETVKDNSSTTFSQQHESLRKQIADIGIQIYFDVENHRYFVKASEVECMSVSTLLSSFVPVFKGQEVASAMGRREGRPSDEILEDWRIRRDYSTVRGTEFHLYAKTFLETGRKKILQTPLEKDINAFHLFWKRNVERFELVDSEFILFDETLRLAGTVDALFFHKKTKKYLIFDWKTNRQIRTENSFHEKLLDPFSDLDSCEYFKYSIQAMLYKELIRRNLNLDIANAFVIHFNNTGNYKVLKLANLDNRMENVLIKLSELQNQLANV